MLSLFVKVCLVIIFIFFINKYDLVEKLDDIIKGKLSLKEGFNNLILPKEEAIKIMIEDQLPIYNLGLVNEGNYIDEMSLYFKRHIFPIKGINTKGKLRMIGHYTEFGGKIREEILEDDALEMFWFIDKDTAYGGSAPIIPLLSAILSVHGRKFNKMSIQESCDIGCKDTLAVFFRSASLITHSRKIDISNL